MQENGVFWNDPLQHIQATAPDDPVFYYSRERLSEQYRRFRKGFPGLVTYAVKANPTPEIMRRLAADGMRAFDVASPAEMALVRAICPEADLHYHNPVRSRAEIQLGLTHGVRSWSVDRDSELDKLADLPPGTEIAVRLKLPVPGAIYDFGAKFGATPEDSIRLLKKVNEMGFLPSLTFHPGTQCTSPEAWVRYIEAASGVARAANLPLARLNVGGGFPAERGRAACKLPAIFERIDNAMTRHFPGKRPDVVCEPGRAMVADCMTLAVRIKARIGDQLFLNDGIYGGLSEWRDLPSARRVCAISAQGTRLSGRRRDFDLFGPTCDSLDRLPDPLALPETLEEGDYLLFEGAGAYGQAQLSRFNGYGAQEIVPVRQAALDSAK